MVDNLRFVLAGDHDVADMEDLEDILSTGRVIRLVYNGDTLKTMRFNDVRCVIKVENMSDGSAIKDLDQLEQLLLSGGEAKIYNDTGAFYYLKVK